MFSPHTLISLACLIANKESVDTSALEAQLTEMEKAQVESVIHSGTCLPENMETLLRVTHERVKKGQVIDLAMEGKPTESCLE